MTSARTTLERIGDRVRVPEPAFDRLLRRRDRKRRNQRIAAAVVGISVALVTLASLVRTFRTVERPADEPTPAPKPEGIFADVAGWIAYGNDRVKQGPVGIWAVDPTRPYDPEARIQLSDRPAEPLAWSSDGSKLLISRFHDAEERASSWEALFVLNTDGTQTQVVTNNPKAGGGRLGWIAGGSFSPDGSQVVFATFERNFSQSSTERTDGIYTVDADGGTPRLILAAGSSDLFAPAFSPDGTQIAYLELTTARPVDQGFSLRVVNADGTGVRVLHEARYSFALGGPAWSPDGTHIAYGWDRSLWVIRGDGSGIAKISDGHDPYWSPDGSRIAFELPHGGPLAIVDANGTHLQEFGNRTHAGPWNPWSLAVSGEPNSTATTGSGLAAPFGYAVVALGVLALLVLAWRAGRTTARIPRA
jgi:Tol biopolymer transport system component